MGGGIGEGLPPRGCDSGSHGVDYMITCCVTEAKAHPYTVGPNWLEGDCLHFINGIARSCCDAEHSRKPAVPPAEIPRRSSHLWFFGLSPGRCCHEVGAAWENLSWEMVTHGMSQLVWNSPLLVMWQRVKQGPWSQEDSAFLPQCPSRAAYGFGRNVPGTQAGMEAKEMGSNHWAEDTDHSFACSASELPFFHQVRSC